MGLRPWGPGVPRWGIRYDSAGNREPLELQQHEPINRLSDSPDPRVRAPLSPVVTPAASSYLPGRLVS